MYPTTGEPEDASNLSIVRKKYWRGEAEEAYLFYIFFEEGCSNMYEDPSYTRKLQHKMYRERILSLYENFTHDTLLILTRTKLGYIVQFMAGIGI